MEKKNILGNAELSYSFFIYFVPPLFMKQSGGSRQLCLNLLEADVHRNMKFRA